MKQAVCISEFDSSKFNLEEINAVAERHFQATCGLPACSLAACDLVCSERFRAVRARLAPYIKPRALVRRFSREVVSEHGLHIEELSFPCSLRLEKEKISTVYAFVLTIGELPEANLSIVDEFYSDLWGTACVGAVSDVLRARLGRIHGLESVSEPVSPGFYGMDVEKLADLFQIIDGSEIGVHLHGFTMSPLKSCAGFFIAAEQGRQVSLSGHCLYCRKGNPESCRYCRLAR